MTAGEALAKAVYRALRRVNPHMNDLALEASLPDFLAALDAAGWAVVPKVATAEIIKVYCELTSNEWADDPEEDAREAWRDLLAARPR